MAVYGHVVAPVQLVGGGLLDGQVRLLYLREGVGRVMAEPADVVPGVVEVVRVAPERGVVAEVLAVLPAGDGLVDRVHSLEDLALGHVVEAETPGEYKEVIFYVLC